MGVTADWTRILNHLGHVTPATRAALRPGDRWTAGHVERELGVALPDDLRAFWSVCGGTRPDQRANVFPPHYTPYSPAEALACRQRMAGESLDRAAGDADRLGWPDALLPVAQAGCDVYMVVDLRPGPRRGQVLELDPRLGALSISGRPNIGALVNQVHNAILHGQLVDGFRADAEDGRLIWDLAEFALPGTHGFWLPAATP